VGRGRRGGRLAAGDGAHAALGTLARRYALFRRDHARGARIPAGLRQAALALLRRGVVPGELYRACGVSWSQVIAWEAWAAGRRVAAEAPPADPGGARVFSVVEDAPGRRTEPRVSTAPPDLELRLGRWSVRVRLEDPGSMEGA